LLDSLPHKRDFENLLIDSLATLEEDDPSVVYEEKVVKKFTKLLEHFEEEFKINDEEVEVINIGSNIKKKELKIVNNPEWAEMVTLFEEYFDIFAWSYRDMPGLALVIALHKIPLYPNVEPKR